MRVRSCLIGKRTTEGWENRYKSLAKVVVEVLMRRLVKKMQMWLYSIKLKEPLMTRMTKQHPYLSRGSLMDQ